MQYFKIYLSGGMGNLSWEEQTAWRNKVKKYLQKYNETGNLKYKIEVFDPTDYYNFQKKTYDSELEVMKFDIYNLKNSDLVFVYFNDPNSIGTAHELAVAWDKRIPIIGCNERKVELHSWLKEDCDKIFHDIYTAIDYIADYYLM